MTLVPKFGGWGPKGWNFRGRISGENGRKGIWEQKCRQGCNISVSQESGCSNLFPEECSQSFVDSWTTSPKILKHFFKLTCKETMEAARASVQRRKLSLSLLQRSCLGGKYRKSVGVKVVGSVDLAAAGQRRLPRTLSLWPQLHADSRNLSSDYYVCVWIFLFSATLRK